MNDKELTFLKEYKELCLKHGMQIKGFDDGAYIVELGDEEREHETIVWEEKKYDDGSVGHSELGFAGHYEMEQMRLGRMNGIK